MARLILISCILVFVATWTSIAGAQQVPGWSQSGWPNAGAQDPAIDRHLGYVMRSWPGRAAASPDWQAPAAPPAWDAPAAPPVPFHTPQQGYWPQERVTPEAPGYEYDGRPAKPYRMEGASWRF